MVYRIFISLLVVFLPPFLADGAHEGDEQGQAGPKSIQQGEGDWEPESPWGIQPEWRYDDEWLDGEDAGPDPQQLQREARLVSALHLHFQLGLQFSEVIIERTERPLMRRLAQRLRWDHRRLDQDMRELAREKGLLEEFEGSELEELRQLLDIIVLRGSELDARYLTQLESQILFMIEMVNERIEEVQTRELRVLLDRYLPIFHQQLALLDRVQEQVFEPKE